MDVPERIRKKMRIAVVYSRFNPKVMELMLSQCIECMNELRIPSNHQVPVPGALEIPLMVKHLIGEGSKTGYDGFIALGCVIRGETYHFEVVSDVSALGLQQVQLEAMVPVVNGILTTDTRKQARLRAPAKARHCVHAVAELVAAFGKV